jgi:electron transport complex protein RnfB
MLIAILAIAALAVVMGVLLGYSALRFRVEGDPVADQIEAVLPQTQCAQCGYPGCRPYAEAVAKDDEAINKCVPGGEAVMLALADLLGRDPGEAGGIVDKPKCVAVIDDNECIGCTLCLQACPVDAIMGAAKQLHGIIASECTGCELCLKPCPVECIHMRPIETTVRTWKWPFPASQPARPTETLPQAKAA